MALDDVTPAVGEHRLALGILYRNGRGVPGNRVQAHKWFNLAAANFPPGQDRATAAERRDRVARGMTAGQIAEAQRLAHEWRPKAP